MRVLIAYDGSECSEAILKDLQFGGLPLHASVMVLSVASLQVPTAHLTLELLSSLRQVQSMGMESGAGRIPRFLGTDDAGTCHASHEAVVEMEWEGRRVKQTVSQHFPEWFVEFQATDGGNASESILQAARDWRADLIIMGSHGWNGKNRQFLRSVSATVAAESPCSVRVVHPRHRHPDSPLNLLLALDGSEASSHVVEWVMLRSFPRNTRVHILNVVDYTETLGNRFSTARQSLRATDSDIEGIHHMLDYYEAEVRPQYPRIESQIRYGDPRQEVFRYAREQEIDAVFLGSHSGSKVDRPSFGSLASAGVREAETTVEIVRKI